MKYSKVRMLAFLLVAVMLTGCAKLQHVFQKKEEEKRVIKIGVSIYDQYDTFISSIVEYMGVCLKAKEEETGVSIMLDVVNAGHSQMLQNDQTEEFFNNAYDIVCVNLVDRTDASTIIEKAKNADIPVIFFNRELVEEDLERWDKLYYVGAEAFESGIMQGKLVADHFENHKEQIDKNQDGKMQYVILEGEAGHQDALVRTEYALNTVAEHGILTERLANEIANWNRGQAMNKTVQWIENFGDQIEVIFANNDDMALGAIDALDEYQVENRPIVVGIDGTDVALEAVQNKKLYGTVLNDAKGQAKAIIELSYSLAKNEPLSEEFQLIEGKYIRLPYEIVTRDNLEEIQLKK